MGYRRWKNGFRVAARPRRRLGRLGDFLLFCVLAAITLCLVVWFVPQQNASGTAHVIDGDSLKVDDVEIRLSGIDAPEARQTCKDKSGKDWPCGLDATLALKRLTGNAKVECKGDAFDKYQRLLARCMAGDLELNAEMVRLGFAVAGDGIGLVYVPEEDEARQARRGVWQGSFDQPGDWRAAHE